MGILYKSLCSNVRVHKFSEFQEDLENSKIYISPRLIHNGDKQWISILELAIKSHNDDWLASQLQILRLLKTHEDRTRNGKTFQAAVPVNAAEMLAEGEFNRFYVRGVCLEAMAKRETHVEVYRGKHVSQPRSESENMIGKKISAKELLDDLRRSQGVDTSLGLPAGPNSGLTVKRLKD